MRSRWCDFRVAVARRVVNYGLCSGGPEARVAMCRYRLQQHHPREALHSTLTYTLFTRRKSVGMQYHRQDLFHSAFFFNQI